MKWFAAMLLAVSLMLVGCEKKGPMEQAADDLGGAMKDTGKEMDKATDDAGKALDSLAE